jgi:TIR domain
MIYLSYATKDFEHGNHLKSLLKPVLRNTGIIVWSKQDLIPGALWQQEMNKHLEQSAIFIAMVSSDFLASDRCSQEIADATKCEQAGKITIVNVMLRPNVLEGLLPKEAMLPSNGKPITVWKNKDAAWQDVVKGIIQLIHDLRLV